MKSIQCLGYRRNVATNHHCKPEYVEYVEITTLRYWDYRKELWKAASKVPLITA